MLIYWDTDLNKSVDFFLNPICILLVVCTSTFAICIAIYANKILFKLIAHSTSSLEVWSLTYNKILKRKKNQYD